MNESGTTVRGTALLTKALDIVELIAESDNRLKFKDIAERTGHSKSTLYRILSALGGRGMIDLDRRDQSYVLGPKFTEMAGSINSSSDLIAVSAASLKGLAEQHGENINLAILIGTAQLTISRWHGRLAEPFPSPLGERKPLHSTGLGKALLASLDDEELARLLPQLRMTPYTDKTHTSTETLIADLEMVRARGFAIDDNEIIDGVTCIAAPIMSEAGKPLAAVSITGPTHRMPPARQFELASVLRRTTDHISQLLVPRQHVVTSISNTITDRGHSEIIDLRAFSSVVVPGSVTQSGFAWFDGPSGSLLHREGPIQEVLLRLDQIDAAYAVTPELITVLSGSQLHVVRSAKDIEVQDAPEVLHGALAFRRLAEDDFVFLRSGGLWRCGPQIDAELQAVFPGLSDAAGFDLSPDGSQIVAISASDGTLVTFPLNAPEAAQSFTLPTGGPPSGVAFDLDGGVWIARALSWALVYVDVSSGASVEIPVPVPTVRGLTAGATPRTVIAGSERLSLSQSLLDVAPASGGVLTVSLRA